MKDLAVRASRLLEGELASFEVLSGGNLSTVIRVCMSSGGSAVAKRGAACQIEAEMLNAIRASGAPAPKVLALEDDILVLEDLGNDTGPAGAWSALGQGVRTLHSSVGPHYGWPVDYSFGPVPVRNGMTSDWPRFWAERRLLAGAAGAPEDVAHRIEKLCRSLPDRLPRAPRPVLLHGDLWGGNVMANAGELRGLIDPACCYGHNEVDLSMLHLFATPDDSFWAGYGAPAPDFEDRRSIYQLWPALVHLRLFGDGYRGLVERLLRRCSC